MMKKSRRTSRIEKVTELLYLMKILSPEERNLIKKRSR
jgi:hypothetical protein